MSRLSRAVLVAACASLLAKPAAAQQRPLLTEDPETIGAGLVLLEGGIEQQHDVFYPVSGLQGDLLRVPMLGVSFGISSIAELQIDGGLYQRLHITARREGPLDDNVSISRDTTSTIEDVVVATKIRLVAEKPGRPSFGVRLATKLPNASNESGLGLDTTDFFLTMLVGKTVQSVRIVGNVGLGILADATLTDPGNAGGQNDVLTIGLSMARAVRQGLEIVGEVNGRINTRSEGAPPGTDSRGAIRLGARYTHSSVRIDGGLIIGMTSRDPSIGFTAGATWVFKGFTVP